MNTNPDPDDPIMASAAKFDAARADRLKPTIVEVEVLPHHPDKPMIEDEPTWFAYKYPDVKTWTVASNVSIASKIHSEAHAYLIAAAPALLAACELTVRDLEASGIDPKLARPDLVAAIKKARKNKPLADTRAGSPTA